MLKNKMVLEKWREMNIVICDDTIMFTEELKRIIKNYSAINDCHIEVRDFNSAVHLLNTDISDADAVLLDIEMPEINGIDVARAIREKYPEIILVFVTGWIQYAPAGYRVNAFRYLLKKDIQTELWQCLDEIQEKLRESSEVIEIETRDYSFTVSVKSILYFEGTSYRSVLLHLINRKEPIECTGKLLDYEQRLAEYGFLRIQKSFLANMGNMLKIRNYKAVLKNGEELSVSSKQYQEICKQFLMWRGKRYG